MASGRVGGFVLDGDSFTREEAERGFALVSALLGVRRTGPWLAAGFPDFPGWMADAVLPGEADGTVLMEYSVADGWLGYLVAERPER